MQATFFKDISFQEFEQQFEEKTGEFYGLIPRGGLSRYLWDGDLLRDLTLRDGQREGEILFTCAALFTLCARLEARDDDGDNSARDLLSGILQSIGIELI